MLVEFSLSNFKSFRRKQTISMVASPYSKSNPDHCFETDNRSAPELLRSAVVFGPNGAGKSTLVAAIGFVDNFVLRSATNTQLGDPIEVIPFKLGGDNSNEVSEFEVIFIQNGNQYEYGISVDSQKVVGEWLFRTPPGVNQKPTRMFERQAGDSEGKYDIYINPSIKGPKDVWKETSRSNASFLSTAVQLSAEAFIEPFSWFREKLRLSLNGNRIRQYLVDEIQRDREKKDMAMKFLQSVDLGIADIKIEKSKVERFIEIKTLDGKIQKLPVTGGESQQVYLGHRINDGSIAYLKLEEESDGTQVLFGLVRPWFDALEQGHVVVIDELSNSLHPLVLAFLVEMFNNPATNKRNAQLLFTSHETFVMEEGRMGRDQMYLVQRDREWSSEIIPLSDFSPRAEENIRRGYLQGRYKAVPFLEKPKHGK